jgi:uncharacterized protein YdaU (DUF1376 family)
MKKSRAYVPWFHGDFLRSTTGWPLVTQAIYWKLLCAQWEQGPLPNNPEWLARIAGCTQAEFDAAWATIVPKFLLTNAGLSNERMAEHAANFEAFRRKQAENGRKGGRATWKTKSNVLEFPHGGAS